MLGLGDPSPVASAPPPTSQLLLETGVALLAEDGAIINREYPT